MTSCDDFELAIEQRLHGALEPAARPGLEEHLSSCPGCRAFEARSRDLEEAMKTHAVRACIEVDWSRLEAGLARWKKGLSAGTWQGLIALAIFVPILGFTFGQLASGIIGGLGVIAWGWIAARRAIRQSRDAERETGALLDFLRGQLDRQIRIEKQNGRALPFLALLPLYLLWSSGVTPRTAFGAAVTVLLFVALALRSRFVMLPRLERERAQLD